MSDVATIRTAKAAAEARAKEALRDRNIRNELRKYSNPKAPLFFFGQLEKKSDGSFCVNEAVSRVRTHPESKPLSNKSRSLGTIVNTWVVGRGSTENGGRTKLFIDNEQEAPVQIIPWDYVEESKSTGKNAIEFFWGSPVPKGEITCCRDVPLIGGKEKHGHVIIYWLGCFLKGFISVGYRRIQYSSVEIFMGDFKSVAEYNQATLMTFRTKSFLMLVPRQNNEYEDRGEHSVLEYRNGDESWKAPRPKNGEEAEADPALLDDGGTPGNLVPQGEEEIGPSVGEVMANAIRKQGTMSDQAEDGTEDARMVATQRANGSTSVMPSATIKRETAETRGTDNEPNVTTQGAIITEEEFLTQFKNYVKNECGFNYDDRDLERFHTCVKTGMMTLIGGEPGSGKSSLFELYSRALAGNSEGCFSKRVDVNPTWMEPSDLMGYSTPNLNDTHGENQFHESQCGLRSFLAELKKQSERAPALVCFEEMNLARIELYFAEFIQIISRYEISAENKKLPSYGGANKQDPLSIPADIRFVGTCNEDPTVKPMSNRFLDRSNVIRLSGDNKAWRNEGEFKLFACGRGKIQAHSMPMVSASEYGNWIKTLSQEDTEIIGKKLDNILNKIRKELSAIVACPSRRVAGEILRYVANRPFPTGVTDDDVRLYVALDEALVQRVISKCAPNALMRGKFKAAADKVRTAFESHFNPAQEKGDKSVEESGEKIVSLTAERLDELEMETKSLFQWSGVEDDSNVNNAE